MELKSQVFRGVSTRADADAVYALLADVPRSVAHFPEMESLTYENGAYVWRMKKLGAGPVSFQVVYAAVYSFDPAVRSVRWDGVPGFGNTQVKGRWVIEPQPVGTRFSLETSFVLEAPFPGFLRGAAEALMARENDRLIATYLQNLKATLDRQA